MESAVSGLLGMTASVGDSFGTEDHGSEHSEMAGQ